jgi:1,4-alpha-glucan branching enzyme
MTLIPVRFLYLTGLNTDLFSNVRLCGSWDANGNYSAAWTQVPMAPLRAEDGCPAFEATVQFDAGETAKTFSWGVFLDGPAGVGVWGIPTEIHDANSSTRTRSFVLQPAAAGSSPQEERYWFIDSRRFGAQKFFPPGGGGAALRFSVWAPNARAVEVVFGSWNNGYIDNAGGGIDSAMPVVPLRPAGGGIWESDLASSPRLSDFCAFDHAPYMFRIHKTNGATAYRTDIFSRCQIGAGSFDPGGAPYNATIAGLDGRVSCSVVIDPDTVTSKLKPVEWPTDKALLIPADEFWAGEFDPERPLPKRLEDLVIYELHVASLGFGKSTPGDFADATDLLDSYLIPLGVNAVELMPVADSSGNNEWGYGNTHYFAVEFRTGGRDHLKHFVRACHQRGIAVILDVVYNHFSPNRERSEGHYDSDALNEDIYLWYEGTPDQYGAKPEGGYLDNGSTDRVPRYWEEYIRKMFVSSGATLVDEFHVDGFRVDLTQAMHADCRLIATGQLAASANAFGGKLLREWTRTLKALRPSLVLIAEEHEDRARITESTDVGGFGFDATWFVDMYHNIVGVAADNWSGVVARAGVGNDAPLRFDWLAGSLAWTGNKTVSYHISHDECGNSGSGESNPDLRSHRTMVQAAHGAQYVDSNRQFAEARSRFAFGMAALSAGTPMFFMAEEVGALQDYKYNDFLGRREDLAGMRRGSGAHLFLFYQDVIKFRKKSTALRFGTISILHQRQAERIIAFRRTSTDEDLLIFATLSNRPYTNGYWVYAPSLPNGAWLEVFNSASSLYGGDNTGNFGGQVASRGGYIGPVVPANGFVILRRI